MTTYTIEELCDCRKELKELTKLHYKESRPYDDIPLSIDWGKLKVLEEKGFLKLFVMREDEKIVGYASFILHYSVEYSTTYQASLNNIFIHPEYRGNGGKFILWCDEQLKKYGIKIVYHHVKAKNDYGGLLKRLGYDIMNIEYAKRLDK